VTPLQDHPLAVCDYRSTDPADYIACDVPSPSYVGESYLLHHNPKHDWWFLKEMHKDEVFVIKMYDSDAERPGGSSIAKCKYICNPCLFFSFLFFFFFVPVVLT